MSASRPATGKEAARRGRLRVAVCAKRLPGNRRRRRALLVIAEPKRAPGTQVLVVGTRGRGLAGVSRRPGNRRANRARLAIRVHRRAPGTTIPAAGMRGSSGLVILCVPILLLKVGEQNNAIKDIDNMFGKDIQLVIGGKYRIAVSFLIIG